MWVICDLSTFIVKVMLLFPPALAGYNNLEVAEYLLQHGADVNAQDKGGLIPLHNAASYGVSSKWMSPRAHGTGCGFLFHKELNKTYTT
jgi:hypothetical protein